MMKRIAATALLLAAVAAKAAAEPPAPPVPDAPAPPAPVAPPVPAPAAVPPGTDFSGEYKTKLGKFSLLEGDDGAVLVSYQATFAGGGDEHLCGCEAPGRRISATRMVVGDQTNPSATLDLKGKDIAISGGADMWSGCCGADWPGDHMKRASAKKPKSCTVTAPRVEIKALDDLNAPIGTVAPVLATAAAGDKAEALAPVSDASGKGRLLVRAGPPGKRVVGLLKRAALKCAGK